MAAVAVTCTPSAPVATVDFCKVTVTDADQNDDAATPDTDNYPVQDEIRYYLTFEKASEELGRSYVFGVNEDGGHVFNNYVFPSAGSWTVRLNDAADDSSVATASVTAS